MQVLFIDFLIYLSFAFGCILLMWRQIELLIMRCRLRHRLSKSVAAKEKPDVLDRFLKLISESFSSERAAYIFFAFEIAILLVSYLLSYRNFGPLRALVISFISFLMPVMFLLVRMEKRRTKASFEGISLISELLRQYRMNNFNMQDAIEKTINAEGDYAISSKWLYRLLLRLRSASGPLEARDALLRFEFSYNTAWAHMLSQCIRISIEDGSDVSKAMSYIVTELKDAEALLEKRKILNSEATRMTLLMVPLMYVFCMGTAVMYLGTKPSHLLYNQFLNPTGYILFLLCMFLFVVNMLLITLITGYRLDY